MENLDTSAFVSGFPDYTSFDPSMGSGTGFTPLPTTSASPPTQQLSMLQNDSAIGLDMDDMNDMPQGRRSSSEEKENMTPAQSRRKAQNRAAYAQADPLQQKKTPMLIVLQTTCVP